MVKRMILSFPVLACVVAAWAQSAAPVPVTVDNFIRAEMDKTFSSVNSFGKITHLRELVPIDRQPATQPNRDTLYSLGVFDLDAGPVTITLPDPGKRYMSLQVIDEDDYTPLVAYGGGSHDALHQGVDQGGHPHPHRPHRSGGSGSGPRTSECREGRPEESREL